MSQGKLVVIEGGDSSGKATQAALLTKVLKEKGELVEQIDFPRYHDNHIGGLIRECLDGKHGDFINTDARLASVLYAADRRESLPKIQSWLEEGKTVVSDRYTSSNLLHQGAKIKNKEKRKQILEWIYKLEHKIMNLPVPDLLLYLDVPATVRFQLLKDQNRVLDVAEENTKHQQAVDIVAEDMLMMYPNAVSVTCMEKENLLPPESVSDIIMDHVNKLI